MKLIRSKIILTVFFLFCISICSIAEESKKKKPITKPYSYGNYLVLTCNRVKGAGKWPISSSQHEVTAINGKKLDKSFKTHVEYLDSFCIPGNNEVVISGYFTMKQIGTPSWPKDSPEAKYMEYSQRFFSFVDFFIATGVRSPEKGKKRFEKEVASKREQYKVEQKNPPNKK